MKYTLILFLLSFITIHFACSDTDYNQGRALYERKCANCHIDDGTGLKGLIPPLAKADFLMANKNELACIIKHGLKAPMMVNGVVYNQQEMPANEKLSDADITNIINYILSAWGNQGGTIALPEVSKQIEACR